MFWFVITVHYVVCTECFVRSIVMILYSLRELLDSYSSSKSSLLLLLLLKFTERNLCVQSSVTERLAGRHASRCRTLNMAILLDAVNARDLNCQ